MKKILQILLTMHILISIGYTEITKKDTDEYWKNSRAINMFKVSQIGLKKDIFKVSQVKEIDAKPILLNAINKFVSNPKYFKAYKETFFSMDGAIYQGLVNFYKTPLGKKYSKLFINMDYMNSNEVKEKYKRMMKNHPLSNEKVKLIAEIDRELNLVKIKVAWQKEFMYFKHRTLYPDKNITDEMINNVLERYQTTAKKYETMLMPVLFQDFSIKELKGILRYASSKLLSIEVEYIYKAVLEFNNLVYSDLKRDVEKFIMIGFCQEYPDERGYTSSRCKKEWINQEVTSGKEENLK